MSAPFAFAARRRKVLTSGLAVLLIASAMLAAPAAAAGPPQQPSALFRELFARVELERLFPDSKTFADAVPTREPQAIMADYRSAPPADRAALAAFVAANFTLPAEPEGGQAAPARPLKDHIAANWPLLIRAPSAPAPYSSALVMSGPYVVPGGRFREVYYWDSYFTMLGLVRDGQNRVAASMVSSFETVLKDFGHIPNGMRTYYLSRSQPPVFYLMVGLTDTRPARAYAAHLAALKSEYRFWMEGSANLAPGKAHRRVVAMPDGSVLNRYWDDQDTPRDESYREDVELAKASGRPAAEVYRDVRAAAESGWDFSSRWLADGRSLTTIQATSITPVDLNSLLFGLETAISLGCRDRGDKACATTFSRHAAQRKAAIDHYLWDAKGGRYLDYNWRRRAPIERVSAATLYPLFVKAADQAQANQVARTVQGQLLRPGGLATTTVSTGQQWDAPNGWAPLQWIAISGLRNYGQDELARVIGSRWLAVVERHYNDSGKLVEKYDVDHPDNLAGGGEYPLQDGFGWTNGVTRALLDFFPPNPGS